MSDLSIVFESKRARTASGTARIKRSATAAAPALRASNGQADGDVHAVVDGATVVLQVTVRDGASQVLEQSAPEAPCRYVHGTGTLLAALERALQGHNAGDVVRVVLAPEDAHGVRQDLPPFRVPLKRLPDVAQLKVGTLLEVLDPILGLRTAVWVECLDADCALLRREHPLAGCTLDFELRILTIEAAQAAAAKHGEG
jgi:FKBP-type peptidyl-prolyl cis-trans isomerase SlyD